LIPTRDKILIFVILAAIFGAGAYNTFGRNNPTKSPKRVADAEHIIAGLPTDAVAANDAFRTRILSEFPLASREAILIKTLADQGFISDGWFSKRMTFRWLLGQGGRGACDFTASVMWEADDQNRLKSLDARFLRTPGCVD
jgi:hypothetical protein